MKSPCDSQESPRKNLIYMPADSTCPMDGGEMLDRSVVTLHARPWALFASSKGSRDMCTTNVFETERTLHGSWRAPDSGPSFGVYAHYFLAWIRPHEVIIPYRNEFRLAIGQTKSGDLVVNRQLDLTTSKLCWLQDLVCVNQNTKLYRNVSKSYKAPNGEVFKINNAYRVSFTDNSDKLENITFKAFADLDGITYGITKNHRPIDMPGIKVF